MRIRERFNPRAPCGARLRERGISRLILPISTHAPLAGRDKSPRKARTRYANFNPRAPCGARLYGFIHATETCKISTHAPLAGRDGE